MSATRLLSSPRNALPAAHRTGITVGHMPALLFHAAVVHGWDAAAPCRSPCSSPCISAARQPSSTHLHPASPRRLSGLGAAFRLLHSSATEAGRRHGPQMAQRQTGPACASRLASHPALLQPACVPAFHTPWWRVRAKGVLERCPLSTGSLVVVPVSNRPCPIIDKAREPQKGVCPSVTPKEK